MTTKIMIYVAGGIGDQVCAEPTIRYAVKAFPELEISVLSAFTEFFSHIKGVKNLFQVGVDKDINLKDYVVRGTYPGFEDDLGSVLCSVHTQPVEYCAMMALKWNIPVADREILLPPNQPSRFFYPGYRELFDRLEKDVVFVHPGQSWDSKTFDPKWWELVVKKIADGGALPAIIGAQMGPTGTVGEFDKRAIDLREKLTLVETTWFLQRARVLLTNDSAPLHIAASTDPGDFKTGAAWIGFLSTAKHPDFLKHWRKGVFGWRMQNLTSGGLWSKSGLSANVKAATKEEIAGWLPEPSIVSTWALERLKGTRF